MLVSSLTLLAVTYLAGLFNARRALGRWVLRLEAVAFGAGWMALVVALLSPLHEWSETLLVAHMAQHELLMLVAAPLIAVSSPLVAWLWMMPVRTRATVLGAFSGLGIAAGWRILTAPATVWLLHAVALWVWHLPSLYEAALADHALHTVQHVCFFVTATLFWWSLAQGRYGRLGYGAAVIYVFATALHSGLLGALLTFSPYLWYPSYATTTAAWGLTALEDQQLAGLVMWVPAGLLFTAGGLVFFVAWLRESDRRAAFGSLLLIVGLAIAASHCRSREHQLVQVREGLQSLEATLTATAGAWLDRSVSSREAYTVLERTSQLVEDQRSTIVKDPRMLADPLGIELSERAERLARAIALVSSYVETGDTDAVRGQLADLPSRRPNP